MLGWAARTEHDNAFIATICIRVESFFTALWEPILPWMIFVCQPRSLKISESVWQGRQKSSMSSACLRAYLPILGSTIPMLLDFQTRTELTFRPKSTCALVSNVLICARKDCAKYSNHPPVCDESKKATRSTPEGTSEKSLSRNSSSVRDADLPLRVLPPNSSQSAKTSPSLHPHGRVECFRVVEIVHHSRAIV
jgi:hypothetical protein